MLAAFLAVGSELLGPDRLDSNSLETAALLERYGVELKKKVIAGDDEADVATEVARLAAEFPLLVVSGGLGPTSDDVTREAVARAFGLGMWEDPAIIADVEARFARMGRTMALVNKRQAQVIDGAHVIMNPRGTAPGMRLAAGGCTIFLLPGVPRELRGLLADAVEPWLAANTSGAVRETRVLKVTGVPESDLEEKIAPSYAEFGREAITVLAKPGDVTLRYTATGDEATRAARLATMGARLRELVGSAVYTDREESLEAVVGRLFAAAGARIATAESCTGGLVAERLTRVPGSSAWFEGAAVTYSNRLKQEMLGVPAETLAAHGAVSEPVARAMAEGVRLRLGTDWGLGVTGIAGPDGGSAEKPVGTVHLALAGPAGKADAEIAVTHLRLLLPFDRERVRWQTSQVALDLMRRRLLALE